MPARKLLALTPLAWLISVAIALNIASLAAWFWLHNNRLTLPDATSKAGDALLNDYLGTAHDVMLIALTIAISSLISIIYYHRRKEAKSAKVTPQIRGQSLLQFIRQHPLVTVIFVVYTIAMVQGTSWLYKDLIGWSSELLNDQLLNNFSFRESFVNETMRRSNFRFYPLAHQDLHILSWFTVHIKVWMLINAAELLAVAIFSAKFVSKLRPNNHHPIPALLLITTLLLLFHPAAGTAFFQVIYCERILILLLILFACSYLHYQQHNTQSSFYSTILFGLIGLFIKDTAILLFIVPPIMIMAFGIFNRMQGYPELRLNKLREIHKHYRLELWLCSLILIFSFSYICLSLLPSIYVGQGYYKDHLTPKFIPDLRCWFLLAITLTRIILAARKKIKLNLLDALNFSALTYATSLLILIRLEGSDYLTLPIQLICILNLTWLWGVTSSSKYSLGLNNQQKALGGTLTTVLILGLEHAFSQPSFLTTITSLKQEQDSAQKTYDAIQPLTKTIKEAGDEVNIIYSRKSRLTRHHHFGRLKYDRLIEYNPKTKRFLITDGIDRGDNYKPTAGDLVVNIDRPAKVLDPILQDRSFELLYRYETDQNSGLIIRLHP